MYLYKHFYTVFNYVADLVLFWRNDIFSALGKIYFFSSFEAEAACGGGERDVDVCSADLLCFETEATGGEHRQRFLKDGFVGFLKDGFSFFKD